MKKTLFAISCAVISMAQAQPKQETFRQYFTTEQQLRSNRQSIPNQPFAYLDTSLKKTMLYDPATGTAKPFHQSNAGTVVPQKPATGGVSASNDFALTKDINISKDANPFIYNFNYKNNSFAVLNNVSYYSADDGINGTELWRSDGTGAGTYMVKDILPGPLSSNIREIIVSNNKIYFIASNTSYGFELWQSDGTPNGTTIVKDITATGGYNPERLTNVNGKIYFVTGNYFNESQLWVSDGTPSGTQIISDMKFNGVNSVNLNQLTAVNNLLFFTAFSQANGNELYRSDGTGPGTYLVKDINHTIIDYFDGPAQLTSYKNKLYFSADDGTGRKLWVSDGSEANTNAAPGNNNVLLQSGYYYASLPFTVSNNKLFFPGFTSASGWELFKYDESAAGVVLVKNATPGSGSSNIIPYLVTNVNNTVYFAFSDSSSNAHLWKSNGNSSGTDQVVNLGKVGYYNFFGANNQLFFSVRTDSAGYELWTSDGTAAGTKIVRDVYAGEISSNPNYLTSCNGFVLFAANSESTGRELWRTDGTTAGTSLVKDANKTSTASSNPTQITALKNSVLFTAFKYERGYELWKSDGTQKGTSLVKDIVPGENAGYPNFFSTKNNLAYFIYYTYPGYAIYSTDGTTAGTKMIYGSQQYLQFYAVTDNGSIFFYKYNPASSHNELWKTDGTVSGTILLNSNLNINAYYNYNNSNIQPLNGLVSIGNSVYFSATDNSTDGYELWKSDGTPGGTVKLKDLAPGSQGSNPTNLIVYNNEVFFNAFDGSKNFLGKSDGTAAGTVKLKILTASNFCVSNNKLFFNGFDPTTNESEFWKTDGTKQGTKLVKDIYKGMGSSNPFNLTNVDGLLYFSAGDSAHGIELWTSDGSSGNTKLVKDINPGPEPTFAYNSVSSSGKLFFVKDGLLWVSDGTEAGTHFIDDNGLEGISNIQNLTSTGDQLFFNAYSYMYGAELYSGNTSLLRFARSETQTKITPVGIFNASLVTNPVSDELGIKIDTKTGQAAQIIITDMAGKKMTGDNLTLSQGTNMRYYNTSKWQHGMYLVTIICEDGSQRTLKALK